jgi:hypothetical protein
MYEHVQARLAFKKSIVMQKERRRRRRKDRSIEIHQVKVASSTSTLYTASRQWWMTYILTPADGSISRKRKRLKYTVYKKVYTLTVKSVAPIPSCQVFFTHRIIFKQQQWSKGATNQLWHLSGFIILITVRLASSYVRGRELFQLAANVKAYNK